MKILIVEDDTYFAEFIAEQIRHWGYKAEKSKTGKAAREKVRGKKFDLVLLNISLPDCKGCELIRQLKDIAPEIGIVTMTDCNHRELELNVRQQKVLFYLIKPFSPDELKIILDHVSRKHVAEVEKRRRSSMAVAEKCPPLSGTREV